MGNVLPLKSGGGHGTAGTVDQANNSAFIEAEAWWNWTDWAWELHVGNAAQKAVLLALAKHADEAGLCYPSVATIGRLSELAERTVQNSLRALSEKGFVVIEERRGKLNLYRLTSAVAAPPQDMHPAGDAPSPRSKCTTPPQEVHHTSAGDAPKHPITPIQDPMENPDCAAVAADEFDFDEFRRRFLDVYPRLGKGEATEDALRDALDAGADPEHILAGARAYADEQEGNKRQYIAYSENWLAQKRWEQFPKTAPGASDPEAIAEVRAKAIRDKAPWIGRHLSAAAARELVARQLVTAEQCREAGVDL